MDGWSYHDHNKSRGDIRCGHITNTSVLNLVFDADIAGSAASITDTTTIYW